LRPNLQVPIFKIFVGWCPKKVPKVPFFFGLEGTRPKEASDTVSTIRDVMPLTVELAVRFSSRTQRKRCSTGAYIRRYHAYRGSALNCDGNDPGRNQH